MLSVKDSSQTLTKLNIIRYKHVEINKDRIILYKPDEIKASVLKLVTIFTVLCGVLVDETTTKQ